MNRYVRRSLKVILGLVLVLILLFLLQVTALAFPSPWFDQSVKEGILTLYFDDQDPGEMKQVAKDVLQRVESVEIYRDDVSFRVFICSDESMYTRFARLSLVPPVVPGFNLSVFNNTFICLPRLEERARTNRSGIKHSALAGDLAQSIAHEIMHDFMQEAAGFWTVRSLPRWKAEAYAEYGANKGAVARDPDATLLHRVDMLQAVLPEGRGREYYRWGLIGEFLAEVRGMTFEEILESPLTEDQAGRDLIQWYSENR